MSVYLKAAEMIASGEQWFSCYAVRAAGGDSDQYAAVFSPRRSGRLMVNDVVMATEGPRKSDYESRRDFRILLLLMAHEVLGGGK